MPTPFRHTAPLPPEAATGRVAEVFEQIARDFGIPGPAPFVALSSAPALLAPAWALMRESLIAGPGDRTGKEVAAFGVSEANGCRFCVDAHTMLLHATGDHALAERLARGREPADERHARVLDWARRTGSPDAGRESPPFPPEEAPGYLGTALAFHFINRIVSALVSERLLPGESQRLRPVRSLAGRSLSRTVRRPAVPGASLPLLDTPGPGPAWAAGTPVGPAYAALRAAAALGAGLLDADDQTLVRTALREWDGSRPPVDPDPFPGRERRPGARLALLAALAPSRIDPADVAAWRRPKHTDHCLVHLVAYGAFAAVDRVESTLSAPATVEEPS
ncbi:carboxymuconolactone decarboxylase family protein [Streptomyces enissocaesilis]|uniref:carboxymuconolactone decarboxylase family protein n=1 Tax=Streptomyces TaxID=1883 RepID=UPI000A3BACC7|nr:MULTISPECIES: carboxymuconolactone decarboxylase family protein [Streptomyces]MDI3101413.1 carboxymuconolactone decarboxylase family protein [Streptomyces sp. AN-3]WDI21780.1 carboxymuconolactone decarboxylase family protein [Streptomyces enissocaesilis]